MKQRWSQEPWATLRRLAHLTTSFILNSSKTAMEVNIARDIYSTAHWSLVSVNVTRKCSKVASVSLLQSTVNFMPGSEQKAPGIRDRLRCWAPPGVYWLAWVQISWIYVAVPHGGQPGCFLPHCPNSIFTQQFSEDFKDLLFLRASLPVSFPYGIGMEQVDLTLWY